MGTYRESNDYKKIFSVGTGVKILVEIEGEEVYSGKGEIRSCENDVFKIDVFKDELPDDLDGEEFTFTISNLTGEFHCKGVMRSEPKTKKRLIVARPLDKIIIRQRRAAPLRYNIFLPFTCMLSATASISEATETWFRPACNDKQAPKFIAFHDRFLNRDTAKVMTHEADGSSSEVLPKFVNLSAEGFRIITPVAIDPGSLLKFSLYLPLTLPKKVATIGYVLRSDPVEDDDIDAEMIGHAKQLFGSGKKLFQTAGSFVAITKEDQDLLQVYINIEKRNAEAHQKKR